MYGVAIEFQISVSENDGSFIRELIMGLTKGAGNELPCASYQDRWINTATFASAAEEGDLRVRKGVRALFKGSVNGIYRCILGNWQNVYCTGGLSGDAAGID